MERVRLLKMRGSDMYAGLYALLRTYRKYNIDQLRVDQGKVTMTFLDLPQQEIRFIFEQRGFHDLTALQQGTLCLLLEHDIAALADRSRYRMKQHKVVFNGESRKSFVYTIKTDYKEGINRAIYYMDSQQTL